MDSIAFPADWTIDPSWSPSEHMMQLKGRDYLNVQNRLLWFIKDQRALIVAGLAKMPHIVKTELVEMDREKGYAHFRTYVRDVLGNEATMYGSESAKDFPDYAEKASTKSLGRALLALGYGTNMAPEMDEGDRVVDSPTERQATATNGNAAPQATAETVTEPALDERLAAILKRNPDLNKTYIEAKKYGLTGNEFFRIFINVTGYSKKELLEKPLAIVHKETMRKYVAEEARKAKEAAARAPDLSTVATPEMRP